MDTFHAVFFTNCRYLFRSQSNIYDKTFCQNISRSLAKDSIINVWQDPEYTFALLSVLLTLSIFESAGGNNNTEVYSERCQTSNMILFTIIFAKSSISDVRQGSLKYPSLTCQTWLSCSTVYPHSRHFLHLPPQTWRHGSVREKTWVTLLNFLKHFFWVES